MTDFLRLGVRWNHIGNITSDKDNPQSISARQKQHPKCSLLPKAYARGREVFDKILRSNLPVDEELLKELQAYEAEIKYLHAHINADLMRNTKILLYTGFNHEVERYLGAGFTPDAQVIFATLGHRNEFDFLSTVNQVE
jgi:hypothetical protein